MIAKQLKKSLEEIESLFIKIHLLQLIRQLKNRREALFKERLDFIKHTGSSQRNWKLK